MNDDQAALLAILDMIANDVRSGRARSLAIAFCGEDQAAFGALFAVGSAQSALPLLGATTLLQRKISARIEETTGPAPPALRRV